MRYQVDVIIFHVWCMLLVMQDAMPVTDRGHFIRSSVVILVLQACTFLCKLLCTGSLPESLSRAWRLPISLVRHCIFSHSRVSLHRSRLVMNREVAPEEVELLHLSSKVCTYLCHIGWLSDASMSKSLSCIQMVI